jgi:hypothetical protein
VRAITGQVESVPIPVQSNRDIPETPIRADDTFYVLHYEGEGYSKVWFRGALTRVHESVMDVPSPAISWWVKMKDVRGNIGWALSRGNFEHQDACE